MPQAQLVQVLKRRWNVMNQAVGIDRGHEMFSGAKTSLTKLTAYSTNLRTRVLKSYQEAEREIWGEVTLLRDEHLLLGTPRVSPNASKQL